MFDALAFLPHAVPSIILAIAAVFVALFLLRGILPLYGTLSILILVYTISRISFATRIINNSLAQIPPRAGGSRLRRRVAGVAGDAQDLAAIAQAGLGLRLALDGPALLSRVDHGLGSGHQPEQRHVADDRLGLVAGRQPQSGRSGRSGDPHFHVACGLAVLDSGPRSRLEEAL